MKASKKSIWVKGMHNFTQNKIVLFSSSNVQVRRFTLRWPRRDVTRSYTRARIGLTELECPQTRRERRRGAPARRPFVSWAGGRSSRIGRSPHQWRRPLRWLTRFRRKAEGKPDEVAYVPNSSLAIRFTHKSYWEAAPVLARHQSAEANCSK